MGAGQSSGDSEDAIVLGAEEYETLKQCAETYREALFVRLCGEVGLRPAEICRLTPGDFSRLTTRDGHHYVLRLRTGDDTGRTTYVPSTVRTEVERYVNEQSIEEDEPIFDLTPRRVQMIVAEVTNRAAVAQPDSGFRALSSRDLRQYYGRRLLHDEGVDPRVVMTLGGWDTLDGLLEYDDTVETSTVIGALEGTSLAGGNGSQGETDVRRAIDQADSGVLITDAAGAIEYANDGFAALTGFTLDEVIGEDASFVYAQVDSDGGQEPGDGESWVRLRRDDGGQVEAFRATSPVVDDHGSRVGTVAVFVCPNDAGAAPPANGLGESGRLGDAIASLRSITEELPSAAGRADAETLVCEHLVATDGYRFALVAGGNSGSGVQPREWAGVSDGAANAIADLTAYLAEDSGQTAIASDDVQVLTDFPTGDDEQFDAVAEDVARIVFVPLTYGETTHGLLVLGSEAATAFENEEREVLAGLGWQVGQAVTDIERKKLLLADSVLELTFTVCEDGPFLSDASQRFGASFELEGLVPGDGQSLLHFVTMAGASPDEILTSAADVEEVGNARLIRDYGEGSLLEFSIDGEEPATTLTQLGGRVTQFITEGGSQQITAEFTRKTDVRAVLSGLQASFPSAELLSKHEVERSVQTADGFRRSLEDELTAKQQSAISAAYHAGYFEWPRGSTAEELADSIGVSSPTLHNHLRKAQQKLLTAFFDEAEA